MNENNICEAFNITPEQLNTNINDNLCNEYLKQFDEQTFILCGIPFKYLVNSNG
jgi:hypothetical protein